jgi:hypothetical protein
VVGVGADLVGGGQHGRRLDVGLRLRSSRRPSRTRGRGGRGAGTRRRYVRPVGARHRRQRASAAGRPAVEPSAGLRQHPRPARARRRTDTTDGAPPRHARWGLARETARAAREPTQWAEKPGRPDGDYGDDRGQYASSGVGGGGGGGGDQTHLSRQPSPSSCRVSLRSSSHRETHPASSCLRRSGATAPYYTRAWYCRIPRTRLAVAPEGHVVLRTGGCRARNSQRHHAPEPARARCASGCCGGFARRVSSQREDVETSQSGSGIATVYTVRGSPSGAGQYAVVARKPWNVSVQSTLVAAPDRGSSVRHLPRDPSPPTYRALGEWTAVQLERAQGQLRERSSSDTQDRAGMRRAALRRRRDSRCALRGLQAGRAACVL